MRTTIGELDRAFRLPRDSRRLFLVRHARPDPAPEGPYDPSLGDRGRHQAGLLAARFEELLDGADVDLVTSPLQRAAQTAQVVGGTLRRAPLSVDALAEVGGLDAPVPEMLPTAPGLVPRLRWQEPDGPFRPHAMAAVREVLDRTSARDVVAVTHGGFINAYVAELLQLHGEFFFYPGHTSLTVVRLHGEKVVLDRLNDVAHLEGGS